MKMDGRMKTWLAGWIDEWMVWKKASRTSLGCAKHRLLVSTVMSLKLLTDELGIQEAGLG